MRRASARPLPCYKPPSARRPPECRSRRRLRRAARPPRNRGLARRTRDDPLPRDSLSWRHAARIRFGRGCSPAIPQLILVDELAHTNVEGSRHAKRWKDIEELLDAGISVWTTLNVQHIESLNDVIAQITSVVVRETLARTRSSSGPIEIELVDVTPEELMERLQAGKVYLPTQAERALNSFFHKGNLVALRELSLRQAADSLAARRRGRSPRSRGHRPWATAERLLVCVGPSPSSAKIIRATKRHGHGIRRRVAGRGRRYGARRTKIGNLAATGVPATWTWRSSWAAKPPR